MTTKDGLVFGQGFLGKRIALAFAIPVADADICDHMQVRKAIEQHRLEYIINAAAVTGKGNIDDCQSTPEKLARTMTVNGIGPAVLGDECKRAGLLLVHLSTGSVYETTPAKVGGITEDIVPALAMDAISGYALSKRVGEISLACYADSLVVRLHMPFDYQLHGRNLFTRMAGYPQVDDMVNTIPVFQISCWPWSS